MEKATYTVYKYRWVVLFFYSMMQCVMQMLWITFAPITSEATAFYGVSALQIGFLSMVFMIVYLFVSIPASWAIDTFGIHKGVGFGVVLTGIFAMMRGFSGNNFTWVLASMIGIAVAQPFILNSLTAMAARWFPLEERATAAGIASLFLFIGIMAGLALTPVLTIEYGIPGMLKIYGFFTLFFAVTYLVFVREKPPTPPAAVDTERTLVFDGLKHIFKQRNMIILLVIFFFGLGMFNAVTTWIEQMIAPRGFSIVQAGTLGALIMVGGIVGCIVIPTLSDRIRKRKFFVILSTVLTLPTLIGLTYATSFTLLLISGFVFGFFFLSVGPIIYQYSAEICYPAPEATSQGLLVLAGQISGILFIFGMDMFRAEDGSMTPFLLVMIALTALNIVFASRLKESPMIVAGEGS
ncbi:MFS transporter [bacterium]|nr:MFS transporter [bacterium]